MKTNEFLKELNKIAYTNFDGKVIEVSVKNGLEIEDDWFLKINPSARNPVVDKQWKNLEECPISLLIELLTLIEKFEETPVKERFSEKKYTIQVLYDDEESYLVEDPDNNYYYFGCLDAKDEYGDKVTFTSDEIESLKNNKRIAIDWNRALITPWVNND